MGNVEVILYIFFVRDGMNNALCLENSFGNLGRVLSVFNEEKIQKKIRGVCGGGGACCLRMQKILI